MSLATACFEGESGFIDVAKLCFSIITKLDTTFTPLASP